MENMSSTVNNNKLNSISSGNIITPGGMKIQPTFEISSRDQNHHQQEQQYPPSITSSVHSQISSQLAPHQHSIIPPRYQPPPQPQGGTGILKQVQSSKVTGHFPPELNVPHLSIKYPPEIPKLTSVHIPDSALSTKNHINGVGNGGNNINVRINQKQLQPSNRLPTLGNSVVGTTHIPISNTTSVTGINYDEQQILIRQQQQHQFQSHPQQLQSQDMLKFVRKPESDSGVTNGTASTAALPPSRLTIEQSRQLQSLISELRGLKEANQRLSDDNQELRDLCCFLDDDRQKGRKLAREWQRFGRYTASVMRQEVSAYQNKLRQLDDKQQELIRDNLELKELCLYLDEERAHVAANALCANCGAPARSGLRDDGDGSSSSTNADDTISGIRSYDRQIPELNLRSALTDQTLHYVRLLEQRIRQLEEEQQQQQQQTQHKTGTTTSGSMQQLSDPISGRPEAVVRALQVLEVREQLERDRMATSSGTPEQMDDGEKALVREMCNVMWRKLEDGPDSPNIDTL